MVYSKAWVRVVCLGGDHRELREGVKWVIISCYCGDMAPNIVGTPGRLWVAAQIVPPPPGVWRLGVCPQQFRLTGGGVGANCYLAPSEGICPHSQGTSSWRVQEATGACQGRVLVTFRAGRGDTGGSLTMFHALSLIVGAVLGVKQKTHTFNNGFAVFPSHGAQVRMNSSPPFLKHIVLLAIFPDSSATGRSFTFTPPCLRTCCFLCLGLSLLSLLVGLPQMSPPCGALAAVLLQP